MEHALNNKIVPETFTIYGKLYLLFMESLLLLILRSRYSPLLLEYFVRICLFRTRVLCSKSLQYHVIILMDKIECRTNVNN